MTASFSAEELTTALSEVAAWGLRAESPYQVLPPQFSPPNESRAKVELLEEGDSAVIGVSEKGWKIYLRSVVDFDRLPAESAAKDDQSFETLDHLLAYLSPEFERKRMELLAQKLEGISVRRSWEGDEEAEATDEAGKEQ